MEGLLPFPADAALDRGAAGLGVDCGVVGEETGHTGRPVSRTPSSWRARPCASRLALVSTRRSAEPLMSKHHRQPVQGCRSLLEREDCWRACRSRGSSSVAKAMLQRRASFVESDVAVRLIIQRGSAFSLLLRCGIKRRSALVSIPAS